MYADKNFIPLGWDNWPINDIGSKILSKINTGRNTGYLLSLPI